MELNLAFWKNKKVLITGHTGFQGSWLCLWLQNLKAEVIGYAPGLPTHPNLFELASVGTGMTSLQGDVRNIDSVISTLKKYSPEIIFHLAGQSLVQEAYQDPVTTYTTNVMGTLNVLEAVRQSKKVRAILIMTSDKCYENIENSQKVFSENDPLGGNEPYSTSKACAELISAAYRNSYFTKANPKVAIATVRAGNVIGGGDWAKKRLIPDVMQALIENKPILLRKPQAMRPWQYILEPLFAYLLLAEKLWQKENEFAESWNFGHSVENVKPVGWIVEELIKRWGHKTNYKIDSTNNFQEDLLLNLDSSKAKKRLGWAPKLSLSQTLDWIIEWYQAYLQKEDMKKLTKKQIERFQNLNIS